MATLEQLGGVKAAGDLILSTDWMLVVNEVVRLGQEVTRLQAEKADLTVVQALQAEVETLRGEMDALQTDVGEVREELDAIRTTLADYFQLRLSTTSATYAVGSQAELVAVVRDLRGQPISFAGGQPRPWLDFVTTWGRLFPAPAFASASRDGGGRRSLSVQVNAAGEARVLLRGETSVGIGEDDEVRMFSTMQAQVTGGQQTVEQAILSAQTPVEAGQRGAWGTISAEYDAAPAGSVRRYLDNLYVQGRGRPVDIDRGRWGQSFEDHRCTVMAFLKPDGDPLSPDQSRGVSSIQVVFRDWFWSWVDVGYVATPGEIAVQIRDDVFDLIEDLPDIDRMGPRVEDVLKRYVDGRGFVEKERNINQLIHVMDEVRGPAGRPDVAVIMDRGKQALEMQRTFDRGGALSGASETGGHIGAIVQGAGRTESRAAQVEGRVAESASATEQVRGLVGTLQNQVQFVSGQVEETIADGGRLSIALTGVQNLRAEVAGISETLAGPTDARVRDLQNNVRTAIERIALLER